MIKDSLSSKDKRFRQHIKKLIQSLEIKIVLPYAEIERLSYELWPKEEKYALILRR